MAKKPTLQVLFQELGSVRLASGEITSFEDWIKKMKSLMKIPN